MYDIDPPSPVLRLSAPRPATQPTAQSDRQHLAQREQGVGVVTGVRYDGEHLIAEIVLNETGKALFHKLDAPKRRSLINFGSASFAARLKALSQADADLFGALDAAL